MRWAVSVLAVRYGESRHTVFLVEATSHSEAIGKGLEIGKQVYPDRDGYYVRDVVACRENNVVEPGEKLTVTKS